jgi:hypothetical protein
MAAEPDSARVASARARVKALLLIVALALAIVGYRIVMPDAPLWMDFGLIAGGIAWIVSRWSRK